MDRFGEDHEFTKLIIDLKGKDPDDAFSSVPYEKGFVFLYYLEKLIGKERFDKFIPHVSYMFAIFSALLILQSTLRNTSSSRLTPMTLSQPC